MSLVVYTDGSAYNHGPRVGFGGWGAVLLTENVRIEMIGNDDYPTRSGRMELLALIHVLHSLPEPADLLVYTDSTYVIGCVDYVHEWRDRGWVNKSNKDCTNVDLLKILIESMEPHNIIMEHVKGHSGVEWNERADELASYARHRALKGVWVKRHLHSLVLAEPLPLLLNDDIPF